MRIIVLGATGMLGYEVFRICLKRNFDVHAIVRNKKKLTDRLGKGIANRLHIIDDIKNDNSVEKVVSEVRADFIINCIGIVKQSHLAEDYYESIAINSLLPHRLEKICETFDCRLLHISTDCVFNGLKGFYKETDQPNAYDLYGKSKHLGEVNYSRGITIRTSIIGHEITHKTHGLLEWFLSQTGKVKGFSKAIFSGLTTLELSRVMLDTIVPQNLSAGIYQVASVPISKYDLLMLIKEEYGKSNEIELSDELVIDRSLDGSRFASLTGYKVPSWDRMIKDMKRDFNEGF